VLVRFVKQQGMGSGQSVPYTKRGGGRSPNTRILVLFAKQRGVKGGRVSFAEWGALRMPFVKRRVSNHQRWAGVVVSDIACVWGSDMARSGCRWRLVGGVTKQKSGGSVWVSHCPCHKRRLQGNKAKKRGSMWVHAAPVINAGWGGNEAKRGAARGFHAAPVVNAGWGRNEAKRRAACGFHTAPRHKRRRKKKPPTCWGVMKQNEGQRVGFTLPLS